MEFTTLGCIPKQPDSLKAMTDLVDGVTYGALTLCDAPFQVNFDQCLVASPGHNSLTVTVRDFRLELFPLRSPLLTESLLISFPPLIVLICLNSAGSLA